LEAVFLDSLLGKAFFCTFQILFYAIRPIFVFKVPFTSIHFFNIFAQTIFDYILIKTCSINSVYYLIFSSFLAGSLHPCAGHFIAEHYIFEKLPSAAKDPLTNTAIPETFSYYGPLNLLTYNVGLHNEHHDFPAVPWSRLPALHELAKEFYADLPRHESWVGVLWQFVWDKEVGITSRLKRKDGGRKVGGWSQEEVQA
jgi:sphingolipid delta-4 desaturase